MERRTMTPKWSETQWHNVPCVGCGADVWRHRRVYRPTCRRCRQAVMREKRRALVAKLKAEGAIPQCLGLPGEPCENRTTSKARRCKVCSSKAAAIQARDELVKVRQRIEARRDQQVDVIYARELARLRRERRFRIDADTTLLGSSLAGA